MEEEKKKETLQCQQDADEEENKVLEALVQNVNTSRKHATNEINNANYQNEKDRLAEEYKETSEQMIKELNEDVDTLRDLLGSSHEETLQLQHANNQLEV